VQHLPNSNVFIPIHLPVRESSTRLTNLENIENYPKNGEEGGIVPAAIQQYFLNRTQRSLRNSQLWMQYSADTPINFFPHCTRSFVQIIMMTDASFSH
jgi:hypothetical protein